MVELVMALEDALNVKIEMDNNVKDIAGLIALIEGSAKA
jgi:acyl carrier protein